MRIQLEKVHWIVFSAGLSLLAVSIIFYYMTALAPLQVEKERLIDDIEKWETQLLALEQEEMKSPAERAEDRFTLEQKLPKEPSPDQFLLELDKAEEMSGSYILSTHYQGEDRYGMKEAEEVEEGANGQRSGNTRSFSYQVTIRSPEYENAERFTEVIDKSSRLIQVDSLTFADRKELIYSDQEQEPLEVNMVITAYYYFENASE